MASPRSRDRSAPVSYLASVRPGGGPNSGVSITFLSDAAKLLFGNPGPWIAITFVLVAYGAAVLMGSDEFDRRFHHPGTPTEGLWACELLLTCLNLIFADFLLAGVCRMAVNEVRGAKPSLQDLKQWPDLRPTLFLGFLVMVISVFQFGKLPHADFGNALPLVLIPAFFIAMGIHLAQFWIIDPAVNPAGAFFYSMVSPLRMPGEFLICVVMLLALNGLAPCGFFLGISITLPITFLSYAQLYRQAFELVRPGSTQEKVEAIEPASVNEYTPW